MFKRRRREDKGIPSGGQFAKELRPPSDVVLDLPEDGPRDHVAVLVEFWSGKSRREVLEALQADLAELEMPDDMVVYDSEYLDSPTDKDAEAEIAFSVPLDGVSYDKFYACLQLAAYHRGLSLKSSTAVPAAFHAGNGCDYDAVSRKRRKYLMDDIAPISGEPMNVPDAQTQALCDAYWEYVSQGGSHPSSGHVFSMHPQATAHYRDRVTSEYTLTDVRLGGEKYVLVEHPRLHARMKNPDHKLLDELAMNLALYDPTGTPPEPVPADTARTREPVDYGMPGDRD